MDAKNEVLFSKFDKEQKQKRNKCGMEAFIIMSLLLLINSFVVDMTGHWGEQMFESLFIIYLANIYFLTASAIRGALLPSIGKKSEHYWYYALILISLFSVYPFYLALNKRGLSAFYENGLIKGNAIQICMAIFFLYYGILGLYAYKKSERS